ncbi:MAG: zinc ABC transporter substrate-binding protein [Lentisphaeria bacterium]|nr:zinc ABC transporter substrate-binding protein [Lentisphaeria bacterium]
MSNRFLIAVAALVCGMLCAAHVKVFVSLSPMLEAVEAIGGRHVEAAVLLPPGSSPETYQPDARLLNRLGKADAVFVIGVPFEEVLVAKLKASFPKLNVIDGTKGMKKRTFEDGGNDPHVWLSCSNMMKYAENVAETLSELMPDEADDFQKALKKYNDGLQKTSAKIRAELSGLEGRTLLVYHPAFGYFLEAYGITQLAIEEEGKEPTGGYLQKALRLGRKLKVKAVFVQPQFSPRSAKTIANELKCRVVSIDPLPKKLTDGLLKLADALKKGE